MYVRRNEMRLAQFASVKRHLIRIKFQKYRYIRPVFFFLLRGPRQGSRVLVCLFTGYSHPRRERSAYVATRFYLSKGHCRSRLEIYSPRKSRRDDKYISRNNANKLIVVSLRHRILT
jgi:hypothetical protein